LFVANKKDYRIPWSQSLELFLALRRLGKKSWLLQYNDYGHLDQNPDAGIRAMQFFDHYLKGAQAPIWMTRPNPARRVATDLRLSIDTLQSTPGPGLPLPSPIETPEQKRLLKPLIKSK
jgi:hypothetical protein